ncbi:MAG: MBL fold metallo-hydrolase [Phycisphaerales bacterium]
MKNAGAENLSESTPRVECFTLGPYGTNCYVVSVAGDGASGEVGGGGRCWIVDASFEPAPIIRHVRESGLAPEALVLTHAHVDHIAGASEVVSAFSDPASGSRLPVWIHADEEQWLSDPVLNLSAMGGAAVTAPGPDRLLRHGDMLDLGGSRWRVIHTPGHSPGGITLYCAEAGTAIVGDALFAGSIGRTDFPGGDHELLLRSIRQRLFSLPGDTRVFPGHGPRTTIDREKRFNPFVRG